MKKPSHSDRFLSAKRGRKRLGRQQRLRKRPKRQPTFGPGSLVGWMAEQRMGPVNVTQDGGAFTLTVPSVFSVINNPEDTVKVIANLVAVARSPERISTLVFDHSRMQRYDLAAEKAFDVVASEIERAYTRAGRKLFILGHYPPDESTKRFLRAIGIIQSLKVKQEYLPDSEEQGLEIFVAHRGRGVEEVVFGHADRKARETKRFVDHINRCLQRNGRWLSDEGIERLATYAGEILANAEEHSGRGEWLLAGYLDDSTDMHMCEIAVLSFGRSFSETFLALPDDSFPVSQVRPYLTAHRSKGLFSPKWTVEDLLTVVALQGGISCKNESLLSTRGKGTIDLIHFFEQVHDECAEGSKTPCEMAILSGNTHIRFDGTYRLRQDSTKRDIIAFNAAGSLDDPPDSKYVMHLKYRLPGTAISIRFALSPADMTSALTTTSVPS
jgi:hypothetical protein